MRVLISGASGHLGSHLVPELLKDGHQVVALVHQTRLSTPGVEFIQGDITQPHFGLDQRHERLWAHAPDAIVQCAGVVSFKLKDRALLTNVNVGGALNTAAYARQLGVPLYHISTVYVCGDFKGAMLPDDLDMGQCHRNEYERSKFTAEILLRRQHDLQVTVIRLSILVGDARVVGIPPLNGLYSGIRGVYLAKRWFERTMALPPIKPSFRLHGDPSATLNIIPVDIAARQVADLVTQNAHGSYYVINPHPPLVREVVCAAGNAIGAEIEMCTDFKPNPAEVLIGKLLSDVLPYLQGEPGFTTGPRNSFPFSATCDGLRQDFIEATTRQFLRHHFPEDGGENAGRI